MAIIKPSNKFEGSDLNLTAAAAPYIKEGIRKALFNKTTNQEGAYIYFLPAYKADNSGNGVWYKKITIRDNFGSNFKEKYYVENRAQDPAEYFANNFRYLYPEEARVTDQEVNGKKFKKYPLCGRVADRVVFNVAFAQNLSAGAHVLDLPLRNGADILQAYIDSKDIMGNPKAPINDPERCIPVFVKLKENSANPWMIQVESSQPVQLPLQLADSDYLYNLDEIFVIKSKEEIIAKLRELYSADVFEDCMNGYPGLTKSNTVSAAQPAIPKPQPAAPKAPVMEIQKATISSAPPQPVAVPVLEIPRAPISMPVAAINPPPTADLSSLPANPMSGKMSREEALRFMNEE
jgi:hypothetical protein